MSEYIITDEQLGLIRDFATVCVEGEKLPRIVRCNDCKWLDHHSLCLCMLPDGDGGYACWVVDPDGFCAWGEKVVSE